MPIRTQWPYAAKAIIQHEWVVNLLNVWVTFKFTMNQTIKPDHDLWKCKVDGVPKATTVSIWQDEWTILLTVPDVLALPGRVTLEYDGPSENLRITWDKQWEPWGPILSVRVPYLWEDILVVDTINKRVGINEPSPQADLDVNGPILAHALANAAGDLKIMPDVQGDVVLFGDTDVGDAIDGKSLYIHRKAAEGDRYFKFFIDKFTRGIGSCNGIFNFTATGNLTFTSFAGNTQFVALGSHHFKLHPTGAIKASIAASTGNFYTLGTIAVGKSTAADSQLDVEGAISSGTLTHALVGPTDNLDVADVNTVFIDCSLNDVIIGGFINGVEGQKLHIVRTCAALQNVTLEHNEPHAFQKIFLHAGLDETLRGEYGGWSLVCDGLNWFDISHSKHI